MNDEHFSRRGLMRGAIFGGMTLGFGAVAAPAARAQSVAGRVVSGGPEELQAALEQSNAVRLEPGVYDWSGARLRFEGLRGRTLVATGATLRLTRTVEFVDCEDLTLIGLTLDGQDFANPNGALRFVGGRNLEILGCGITGCGANGLTFQQRPRGARVLDGRFVRVGNPAEIERRFVFGGIAGRVEGLEVRGCLFQDIGGTAVDLTDPAEVAIESNRIDGTHHRGVNVRGTRSAIRIRDNTITGCGRLKTGTVARPGSAVASNGIYISKDGPPDETLVDGNRVEDCAENGIEGPCVATNNRIKRTGIRFAELRAGSNIWYPQPSGMFVLGDAIDNQLEDCGEHGILIGAVVPTGREAIEDRTIAGNTVQGFNRLGALLALPEIGPRGPVAGIKLVLYKPDQLARRILIADNTVDGGPPCPAGRACREGTDPAVEALLSGLSPWRSDGLAVRAANGATMEPSVVVRDNTVFRAALPAFADVTASGNIAPG